MVTGLKHQKEKRSIDHFAGLEVSVKETSVCIVDDILSVAREVKGASEPGALLPVLRNLHRVVSSFVRLDLPLP